MQHHRVLRFVSSAVPDDALIPTVASGVERISSPFRWELNLVSKAKDGDLDLAEVLAQQAAIASLGAFDELKERVDALVAERQRVVAGLGHQGWHIPETQANFVWLPLGADAEAFAAAADKAGLVVRCFTGEGVRATIAETEANDRLLHVARDFLVARTF